MKVNYTGKPPEITVLEKKKIQARIDRIAKLVDGRGEKEIRIFFHAQKREIKAEATLNYHGHAAIGIATGTEVFKALADALDKLEKQVLKMRAKWRDTTRTPEAKLAAAPPEPKIESAAGPRISRVVVRKKPMTVDEALLVIGPKVDYFPFRDIETGQLSVLIRRGAGQFDLVES